jgi:integrase/recombinase XerD
MGGWMSEVIDYQAQFEAYLLTEKRVSDNTFAAYSRDIRQLFQYLKNRRVRIEKCAKEHLRNFLKVLKEQGVSAKSLSRKISAMKLFYVFLKERYQLPNVAGALTFPTIEKKLPNYLSEEEVQQLLIAAHYDTSYRGIRNKIMLYLLYASGVRVSELVSMSVDQLHFDSGFVHVVGKGKKERVIPLPKNLLDLLRYYLDHVYPKLLPGQSDFKTNYLFFSVYKNVVKPMSRQFFWQVLKKILMQAGITRNVSPHSLRHSLATHLLKNGADIRSLQMLLGHENLSTVQVYTHLSNPQLREVYDKKHPRA